MTNKANTAVTIARYGAAIGLLCLLPTLAMAKDGPYLTWRAKAAPVQATDAPPLVQAPQVAVPPSPYGQVGDPYMHVLTWNTKAGARSQPVAAAAPVRRAPVQQPAPVEATAPVQYAPAYQPQRQTPAYRTQAPQYRAQPMASTLPEPARNGPDQDEPMQPMARQPLPAIAAQTPLRQPAPRQTVQAAKPAPQAPVATASNDGGAYQVPATSPYAARIAAARAAQTRAQGKTQTQSQPQAAAAPAKPAGKAAPHILPEAAPPTDAPVTETASDDKPFVPGQHYTDASEAPRLYSLHRAYGLTPDKITVDSDASGAVLDTSRLDAAQEKAAKAEKADEDAAGDDPDADGVSGKTSSETQNASADKTKAAK